MSRRDRGFLVAAAIFATAALLAGIASTDLWPPDETRVAEIAREMPGRDGWLVPELNGEPFLEEPPLFYWLQAAMYRLEPVPSALGARLPAAVAAVLGVVVTALLARSVGASAALAALVLASAPEWWWMARSGTPDVANATAAGLALLAFFRAWCGGGGGALVLAATAAAVAFWLKSLLGIGLATLAAGLFVALRGLGRLRVRGLLWAASGLAVATGAWLAAVGRAHGGGAVEFFLLANHVGRVVAYPSTGHLRPLWYYVMNGALDLLPWSIAIPAATLAAWKERQDPAKLFVLVWAGVMAVALSVAATKRPHYLLPAYPAFAVLVALWWPRPSAGRLDRATRAVVATVAVVVYPVVALGVFTMDPAALMAVPSDLDRARTFLSGLARVRPGELGTAVLLTALGVLVVRALRAGRRMAAAAALGISAIVVHLLVTLVVLPRFDPFVSARMLGEALGRAADEGIALVAFGFDNREELSPFLFYGRHRIVEAKTAHDVERHVAGARACVLMPARAYRRSLWSPRPLATARYTVGELELVLVSGAAGACPAAATGDRSSR